MRIVFLLNALEPETRVPHISPVTAETITRLREMGTQVDLIVPEGGPLDIAEIRPRHDLYVLRSITPLCISYAGALEIAGARVVNTFRSTSLAGDRIAATALMAASGVPLPPSFTTGRIPLFF